jgi:SAM-dependent methyltransferase
VSHATAPEPPTWDSDRTERLEIASCQACGSSNLRVFFEVKDIPVHSTLLFDTPAAAKNYPRGNLKLGFCRACGFIQNVVFDPGVHEYSPRCEESQGFSPRFNDFLRGLTQGLIDRYGIRGKTVLEIGCGKGDFLELICELGGNRGIGIDPSYVPNRKTGPVAERMQFIQDLYTDNYAGIRADVIACRHTLEHISPVRDFVRIVRRQVESQPETLVVFELPDVYRVLREAAFWDIYYEHCSYFSLGSLARLFRGLGFEVLEIARDFGDQYLVIEARLARPGAGGGPRTFAGEDDMAELAAAVDHYEKTCNAAFERWRASIRGWAAEGKRVVVWGSSSKGVSFLTTLGLTKEIGYVVDVNVYRQRKYMPGTGHEIVEPARLAEYRPDVVVLMNPLYTDEVARDLRGLGLEPQIVAV